MTAGTPAAVPLANMRIGLDPQMLGSELHDRIRRLYPICRSITGDGVRRTLQLLSEEIKIQIEEVPTGTQVFDWTVPKEWNIRDAYIKDSKGDADRRFQRVESPRRQLQRAGP